MPRKRRPPVRTEFGRKLIWTAVEFERRYRNLGVTDACKSIIRQYGGVEIQIGDERNPRTFRHNVWDKVETLRGAYYASRRLLKENPSLIKKWEFALMIDLEAANTRRSVEDVNIDHQPEWIAEILRKDRPAKK